MTQNSEHSSEVKNNFFGMKFAANEFLMYFSSLTYGCRMSPTWVHFSIHKSYHMQFLKINNRKLHLAILFNVNNHIYYVFRFLSDFTHGKAVYI